MEKRYKNFILTSVKPEGADPYVEIRTSSNDWKLQIGASYMMYHILIEAITEDEPENGKVPLAEICYDLYLSTTIADFEGFNRKLRGLLMEHLEQKVEVPKEDKEEEEVIRRNGTLMGQFRELFEP